MSLPTGESTSPESADPQNATEQPDEDSVESQIQNQLSKAAELLEEVARLGASTNRRSQLTDHLEARFREERDQYRRAFSTMLDDVTELQGTAERLARKLIDTIDDLERNMGPESEFPPLPTSLGHPDFERDANDAPDVSEPSPEELDQLVPDNQPVERADAEGVSETHTVLVHGMHQATQALSLKRFLEQLPSVESVSTHEFSSGVLRLELETTGSMSEADVRAWNEEGDLEPIRVRPGLIELTL